MKNLLKKLYMLICISILFFLFSYSIVFATTSIPFAYNILPTDSNLSIIDTKAQKKLTFKLYESGDKIFYNNTELKVENNSFQIDVSKLTGKKTLTIKNDANEESSFTYYFSDKNGKVSGYELVKDKKLTTYVTTYKNVKIIYTSKEAAASKRLVSYLKKLPDNLLENVKTITMIPYETTSNIAGATKEDKITLYKFSQYSPSTQKNIIYHEITHTWANYLMEKQVIDYSYTDYSVVTKNDKNFVSNYSKRHIKQKENYSEDFAESVAFYFISKNSFKKNYPNRFNYITDLMQLKNEKNNKEE